MKILYDCQIFEKQRFGGVSRYFFELINQFRRNGNIEWELPIRYSNNTYLKNLPGVGHRIEKEPDIYEDFFRGLNFKGKWRLYKFLTKTFPGPNCSLVNRKMSVDRIRSAEYDIFHPTYYDDYFLEYIADKPFVLTVYDMIHEIYGEYFSPADRTSMLKKRLVQKAARIIAISENTKKDLVNIFGINENRVTVTHLGTSINPDTAADLDLPAKYLLFVGERGCYKNFYFLIRSLADLLLSDADLKIVCAGSSLENDEIKFFENLGLKNKIIRYSVDDAGLASLYKNALAFVFPSLYEGFGIPVLEAFRCGCPAILSRTGSLPEVGTDAAVYFEPKDALSLRKAVTDVITSEKLRKELIRKGYERIKNFSWEKTAEETDRVYKEVLAE